jgi:hypothetical protein
MRFVKFVVFWTGYVLILAVGVWFVWTASSPTRRAPLHTAIPACVSTHKQLVIVPVECGKSDICEAPLIVDVCDQLTANVSVPGN